MMLQKSLEFTIVIVMLLCLGGLASGQCDPDSNDTAADAVTTGLSETVSGYVCPDDQIDYYTFEITDGTGISGTITFESPQRGTVLRISGAASGVIFEDDTTDILSILSHSVSLGSLAADTYYIRVSYWSSYAHDHEYTITMALTDAGASDCLPDGNDEPDDAWEIGFGETAEDWVCDADRIDIYYLTVATDDEGAGTVTLTADTGELRFYLYDSSSTELHTEMTSGGTLEYGLGTTESPLAVGDYYIGIILPLARDDESSYILELEEYSEPPSIGPSVYTDFGTLERVTPGLHKEYPLVKKERLFYSQPKCPWPMQRGGPMRTGRSFHYGPLGETVLIATETFDYDFNALREWAEAYKWLLVGPKGQIVFTRWPEGTIVMHTLTDELAALALNPTASLKPICFDSDGRRYETLLFEGGLRCFEPIDRPEGAAGHGVITRYFEGEPEDIAVELAGRKIYTSVGGDTPSLTAWKKGLQGDDPQIWHYDMLDSPVISMTEDTSGPLYVRTHGYMYKFRSDGYVEWRNDYGTPKFYGRNPIGPLIGRDRRIYVYSEFTNRYTVFNTDGSEYKRGGYGHWGTPIAASVGSDGRLYIVDADKKITCYDDWDEEVWQITVDGDIHDMIMDWGNRIYVAHRHRNPADNHYYYRWSSYDSSDGSLIYTETDIEIPHGITELDLPAELAIAEGNRLVYLHWAGYLYVFGPE